MKKLVETNKQERNRRKRGEQGSVTLFVLIAMIFFLTVGVAVYISNVNNSSSQQRDVKKIQSEYNDTGDVNKVYEDQKDRLNQRLFITVKDNDKNIYQEGKWTNKVPLTVEVKWPDGLSKNEKIITVKGKKDGTEITVTDEEIKDLKISESCTISAKINGTTSKIEVLVDTTSPDIEIEKNGGNYVIDNNQTSKEITTTITVKDEESGVDKVLYKWLKAKDDGSRPDAPDEKDLKTLEGTTANVTNTISESGKYYLYVKAQDKAENESEKWSEPFNVINKADVENTIKIAKEPDGWTNEDVKVTVDYGNILTTFRRQGFGKTENEARQDAINNTIQTKNPITVTVKENGIIYVSAKDQEGLIDDISKTLKIDNIDKLLPEITYTKNPAQGYTNKDVVLTITLKDQEANDKYGCSKVIAWQISKDGNLDENSNNWTNLDEAKEQTTVEYSIKENGTYYIYAKDQAGNVAKEQIVIDQIDKNPPKVEVTGNPTTWVKGEVELDITAKDDETGIKEIKINGQKVTATIDEDKTAKVKYPVTENGTINIEVTDEAGNVTTKTITVDKIDNKGPEVTITGNPENWTNKDATLHVKAKDDASGIQKVTITQVVDGKEESKDVNFTTNEDGSIDLDYTVDKNQTIKISVTDKAGNTTTKTIVVDKIDKEKPTLKAPTAVATTNTVTVTFNQTDALSGIDEETIRYAIRKQGEDEWEIVQNSEKVNTFTKRTKDTLYEVKTIAKDKAGNEMESEIVIVRTLNLTEPLIKQNPETITNENVKVTILAPDAQEGTTIKYGTDGVNFESIPTNPYTFEVTKNQTIYALVENNEGEKSNVATHQVDNIDKLLPIVTNISASTKATNSTVTITAKAKDQAQTEEYANSGIVAYMFSKQTDITNKSEGWNEITQTTEEITKTQEVSENGIWYFYVKDAAGNVNKASEENKIEIGNIDKTLPIISVEPQNKEVCKITNVTIHVTDEGGSNLSDSNQYEYQLGESNQNIPTGNWLKYTNNVVFNIGDNITGTRYLWVKEVKDNAQNISNKEGTKVSTYHVFGPYVFDNSAPEVTFTPNGNDTYSKTQKTKVTVTDVGTSNINENELKYKWVVQNEAEPAENEIDTTFINGANIENAKKVTGKYYLYVLAKDNLGNTKKAKSELFYLDNTNPNSEAPVKKVATSSSITVEFKQTDSHSQIDNNTIYYGKRLKGTNDWTWEKDANLTHKFKGLVKETTYEICTKASDNAGNGEQISNIVEITTEKIDKPTITTDPNAPTNKKVKVTVTYPEIDGGKYKYSEDGINYIEVSLNDGEYVTYIEENKTIYALVEDENEQTSEVATLEITFIDTKKPTVTITPNGGTYELNPGQTNVKENVTITAKDTGTSGLNETLQYAITSSNTQKPTTGWTNFENGSTNEITLNGGNNYIWFNITDNAGNEVENNVSNVFKVSYKIIYNANGGQNAPNAQTKEKDVNLTLSSDEPTWDGYTFKGWSTSKESVEAEYKKGATYSKNEATNLYAVWDAKSYVVTFNPQGGEVTPTSKDVVYNKEYGQLPTPTKQGYRFGGWYLENTYENKVEDKTIVSKSENHTLYAKWTSAENTPYTIYHYVENANDNGYTLYKTEGKEGKTNSVKTLLDEKMVIDNCTYKYASLEEGGSEETSLTINADGTSKAYLYYTRNKFTLTLSKNEHVASVTGDGSYKWGQDVLIDASLNQEDGYTYTWVNWTENGVEKTKDQKATIKMSAQNMTLVANATRSAKKYIVTYNSVVNGGTTETIEEECTYTQNVDLSKTVAKTGYTFIGWNTNKDDTSALSTLVMPNKNITIYAIFKKDIKATYIDYSATTKQIRTQDITIYNNQTATITVPEQNEYNGWTKNGWTKDTSNSAAKEIEARRRRSFKNHNKCYILWIIY